MGAEIDQVLYRFQFLIGRLATGKMADEPGYLIKFQFLIGRLATLAGRPGGSYR